VFAGEATYLVNHAQADDLTTKGPGYLGGPQVLTGVRDYLGEDLAAARLRNE